MTYYGQVVIGPPGSGKTTFCRGMAQFLRGIGRRPVIVNLDPANDELPYEPDVDIADLIQLEEVMDKLHLGPNGGMIYCLEHLEQNLDWLVAQLEACQASRGDEGEDDGGPSCYYLFDFPGQVELFTHHSSVHAILEHLTARLDYRLAAVSLVDAHHCCDPAKFISVVLLCLSTMLRLGLPHLNVLSKVDLVEQYGSLAYNLEYYTEAQDLERLVEHVGAVEEGEEQQRRQQEEQEEQEEEEEEEEAEGGVAGADGAGGAGGVAGTSSSSSAAAAAAAAAASSSSAEASPPLPAAAAAATAPVAAPAPAAGPGAWIKKHRKLNRLLAGVAEDFGLVGFSTLNIQDSDSVGTLLRLIDKANGYCGPSEDQFGIVALDSLGFERVRAVEAKHMSTFDTGTEELQEEMRACVRDNVAER